MNLFEPEDLTPLSAREEWTYTVHYKECGHCGNYIHVPEAKWADKCPYCKLGVARSMRLNTKQGAQYVIPEEYDILYFHTDNLSPFKP